MPSNITSLLANGHAHHPDGLAATLATLLQGHWDQKNRPIRLRIGTDMFSLDGALQAKCIDVCEEMNADACVQMKLLCLSTRADLPAQSFIGQPISVETVTDKGGLAKVNAIITRAVPGPCDGGVQLWLIEAADVLTVMDQGCNERVLINGSVLDLLQTFLSMWLRENAVLAHAFDFDLGDLRHQGYPMRQFCMQTGESDARYVRRLLRKHGINWVIVPGRIARGPADQTGGRDVAHTVCFFADSMNLHRNAAGTVAYKFDGASQAHDAITDWSEEHRLVPGKLVRQSVDYKTYSVNSIDLYGMADQGEKGQALATAIVDHQFDPPHWGDDQADYRRLSLARIKYHEMRASTIRGASGVRTLAAGTWMTVTGRPNSHMLADHERGYVITKVRHFAQNNYGKDIDARIEGLMGRSGWRMDTPVIGVDSQTRRYGNTFEAVKRLTPIVPQFDARLHWPCIPTRTAIVVGPKSEEIHIDELGRPLINFPGVQVIELQSGRRQGGMLPAGEQPDLHPAMRTSAPVRMASPYASDSHGHISPPRIGDEVLVGFVNGSPDRPFIQGSVYSPRNRPPSFGHTSGMPGDRFLSGIKLKEVGSNRASDLRLDATPGQTGARLYSDHAHTRLSLGFVTAEHTQGAMRTVGEGIYACTDAAASLRAARGLLLSAWPRLMAGGQQLDCTETVALMATCLSLLKSMGDYSAQHQGLAVDTASQAELKDILANWEAGTNTDPRGLKQDTSIIAQTSPQGMASSTPKSIVQFAGQNVDTVAQQNVQHAAGQHYSVNAGQGISHFAHAGGIRQIAHQGDHLTQSQHGDIVMESARNHISRTVGHATHMAKTHTFIAEDGSFIKIGDGQVSLGSNGPIKAFGSAFPHGGPQTMSGSKPEFGKGQPEGQFILRFGDHNDPHSLIAPHTPYETEMSDGSTIKGVSDAQGRTSLTLREAMHIAAVRIVKS